MVSFSRQAFWNYTGVTLPEDTTIISLATSMVKLQLLTEQDISTVFESKKLTPNQNTLLNKKISERWYQPSQDSEVNNLATNDICNAYRVKYVLKKIYEKYPSLDSKDFKNLSKRLKIDSIEAMREGLFSNVGIKNLAMLVDAYLEVNLKKNLHDEKFWISKILKSEFLCSPLKDVSEEKRNQLNKLIQDLFHHIYHLWETNPDLAEPMKKELKSEQIQTLCSEKLNKINNIAYAAMEKMPSYELTIDDFKNLVKPDVLSEKKQNFISLINHAELDEEQQECISIINKIGSAKNIQELESFTSLLDGAKENTITYDLFEILLNHINELKAGIKEEKAGIKEENVKNIFYKLERMGL